MILQLSQYKSLHIHHLKKKSNIFIITFVFMYL